MATTVKEETRGRKPSGKYKKWKEEFLFDAYELAKQGLTNNQIAQALGLNVRQFHMWAKDKPSLVTALARARQLIEEQEGEKDFIISRLSPEARKTWDKLKEIHLAKELTSIDRDTALVKVFANCREKTRQQLFCHAVAQFDYDYNKACKFACVSEKKLREWLETSPGFKDLLNEIQFSKGNFYEGALVKKVAQGDTAAVIFVNKTFNGKRGYSERQRLEIDNVNDQQSQLTITLDDLPLEMRKGLLEVYRKKREQLAVTNEQDVIEADFEVKNGIHAGSAARPERPVQ